MLAAELMPAIPYIHQYTSFRFRWPWLHNINWRLQPADGIPEGRPVLGGHLQWLDADMPQPRDAAPAKRLSAVAVASATLRRVALAAIRADSAVTLWPWSRFV